MAADDYAPPVDQSEQDTTLQWDELSHRVFIIDIVSRSDGGAGLDGKTVTVGGWVRTGREQGKGSLAFLQLNDGSCPDNLQVIVHESVMLNDESVIIVNASSSPSPLRRPLRLLLATGTSVHVEGKLQKPPEGSKQNIELKVQKVLEIGTVDSSKYPLPKTQLPFEYLRDFVHLRARTHMISTIFRIRDGLSLATQSFFHNHKFRKVHTPIITTSDCEGAGEVFQVTTMLSDLEKVEKDLKQNPLPSESDIEAAKLIVGEKGEAVKQLKKSDKAGKVEISVAVAELTKAKQNVAKLEERSKFVPGLPLKDDGKLDYSKDFFGRQTFLSVSGQLHLETFCCALDRVYTFGPTFRAEHSHTSRHLAEFWMVEAEMAFANLKVVMDCAEMYVKFLCQYLLDECFMDMQVIVKNIDKTAIDRLRLVLSSPFVRISYTDAVELLEKVTEKNFENKVEWGIDLASEHERYLTEVIYKKPVIVYNYPKGIKAFYMRLNDDNKTVAAMDVLVPKVGELIGGSQREERYDVLERRILEAGLSPERYDWYLDLRRYGTVKHGGFGLGFERMVLFATGIDNIRDVIPIPRYPGSADL